MTLAYDGYVTSLNSAIAAIKTSSTVRNVAEFDVLVASDSASFSGLVSSYRPHMVIMESSIQSLYDLRYYKHLTRFAQEAEDPLCNKSINKFCFVFFGVLFMLLSNLAMNVIFLRMLTIRNKIEAQAKVPRRAE